MAFGITFPHAAVKSAPLETHYNSSKPFKTLFYLYRQDSKSLSLAVFFFIIKGTAFNLVPFLTAAIINIVAQPDQHQFTEIWFYAAAFLLIALQDIPSHALFVRYLSTSTRSAETALRAAIANRLQTLSMDFYHRRSTGVLQTKLLRDVEAIEGLTRQLFETIPSAMITLIVATVITAIRAPMFLIFFVFTVPVTVGILLKLNKSLKQRNTDFRHDIEEMSSRLSEMIHMIPLTRAHGVERDELERLQTQLDRVRKTGIDLDTANSFFAAMSWFTSRFFNILCLATAAYVAYKKILPLSAGDVVLLTGFFNNLIGCVLTFTGVLPQISRGFDAIRSVGEILESEELEHNADKAMVNSVQGHFEFKSVGLRYTQGDEAALNGIDLEVQPGECIAFVGHSGAGKSTMLNLIIGYLRPTYGEIWLDGKNMNTLDLRSYRQSVSVVPQETILFRGTVRENVLYGSTGIDDRVLWQAIQDANAAEFVERLPKGLDTIIGENGAQLSGGQRQRIAIARALIRNPRVLLLDEATSALDTVSERLIQEALDRLMKGRTTFIVAHRLSTIQRASRIVVLDRGRISEVGTHADLLRTGGAYAALHDSQAVEVMS